MHLRKSILKSILKKNGRRKFKPRENFAVIEDRHDSTKSIHIIASAAVQRASLENRRFNLAKIYIRGNKAIKTNPNGTNEIIAEIRLSTSRKYKVGEVLHARKN